MVASPVAENEGTGISLTRGVVADSSAVENETGIETTCCGAITGATASLNVGNGIIGFGLFVRNAAFQNGAAGFMDDGGTLLIEIA